MAEHYNARTVEVRYVKEPGTQKLQIIDATALEPGEVVVVVVMRGELDHDVMVKRRFKPDDGASLRAVISDMKAEAYEAVTVLENDR